MNMSAKEGKIKKKIVILLMGFLLCFAIVEIGLYGIGYLFKASQEKLNKAALLEKQNSYRIICLGDSTTAIGGKESWPGQLEEVLNDRNPGKDFCVINKGVVLIDSGGIWSSLEKSLSEYDPHMIIIMAGLNDAKKDLSKSLFGKIKHRLHILKTYRLAEQFWPAIFHANPIDYDNTEKAYKDSETIDNFNKIKNLSDAREIKLVIMQYPLRAIEPLKDIFHSGNDVIYVDNEDLFKEALREGDFEDYFADRFAGDFGHCTKKGNRMIAENIVSTIEKSIARKQ